MWLLFLDTNIRNMFLKLQRLHFHGIVFKSSGRGNVLEWINLDVGQRWNPIQGSGNKIENETSSVVVSSSYLHTRKLDLKFILYFKDIIDQITEGNRFINEIDKIAGGSRPRRWSFSLSWRACPRLVSVFYYESPTDY